MSDQSIPIPVVCKSLGVDFRVVPWNDFYAVGSDGTVWCRRTRGGKLLTDWRQMKLIPVPPDDRPIVGLRSGADSKLTRWYVHVLILTVFVGPCPNGLEGCHKDGDSNNCALGNLRWDTHKSNMTDRTLHGRTVRGERHYYAKLTVDDVKSIRQRCASGEFQKNVALDYGINASCVQKIVSRESWSWVE